MRLIEIDALPNGAHRNQTINVDIPVPDGWAYIPDDMTIPQTFPFVDIVVEEKVYAREVEVQKEVVKWVDTGEVNDDGDAVMERVTEMETVTETQEFTMMTVTSMTEGTVPEPEPEPEPEEEITVWDELDAAYQEGVDSV